MFFQGGKFSIRYKLMFSYTTLFVLVLAAICLVRYLDARSRLKDEVENNLRSTVDSMAAMVRTASDLSVRNYLRGVSEKNLALVEYYYHQYRLRALSEEEAKKLAADALASERIGTSGYIYCLQSTGQISVHSLPFERGARDLNEYPYLREQISRKEGYMVYDWQDSMEGQATPKALYMKYFEPWDWIITSLAYLNEFTTLINSGDFLSSINVLKPVNSGFAVAMMDTKGRYLISSGPVSEGDKTPGTADARLVEEMLKERAGMMRHTYGDANTGNAWTSLEYFMYLPEYGWIILAGGKEDVLYAPLDNLARNLCIFMAVGTSVVLLFSWLACARFITQLRRFKEQLRSAAKGNLNARLTPENADELGEMAEDFNSLMLGMTEQTYALERIVDSRTAEYREQLERLQTLGKEYQIAEAAASNKVSMFFELLDSIPNPICYRDREGRFTGCNEAYSRSYLGMPRHAVLSHAIEDFPDIFSAEAVAQIHEQEQKVYSGEAEYFTSKITLKCADGATRTFHRCMAPIRDAQGGIRGTVTILTDISELAELGKSIN